MSDTDSQTTADGRRAGRVGLEGKVTIRFATDALVGSGQNISEQGVFFLTDASLPVTVEIEGREGSLVGELVRVESMGPDQLGVAVKFSQSPAGPTDTTA